VRFQLIVSNLSKSDAPANPPTPRGIPCGWSAGAPAATERHDQATGGSAYMKKLLLAALLLLMAATVPAYALEVYIQGDDNFSYSADIPDGGKEEYKNIDYKMFEYSEENSDGTLLVALTYHSRISSCEDALAKFKDIERNNKSKYILNQYGANECVMTNKDDDVIYIEYVILQDGDIVPSVQLSVSEEDLKYYKNIIDTIIKNFKDSAGYSENDE
jgi:hypothetical protein